MIIKRKKAITNTPLESFKELCRKKYMVDKSLIQDESMYNTPFILELKKDENVDTAIKQIKEKEYF